MQGVDNFYLDEDNNECHFGKIDPSYNSSGPGEIVIKSFLFTPSCRDMDTIIGDTGYLLVETNMDQPSAKANCENHRATLALLNTETFYNNVKTISKFGYLKSHHYETCLKCSDRS